MTELERLYEDFLDHKIFAEETLSVRFKDGQLAPYRFAPSQDKFWTSIKRQSEAGKPIRQVWLKSRQVFGSTTVAGYFYQQLAFHTGKHARVIAHEKDAAADIFDYYKTFDDTYQRFRETITPSRRVQDSQNQIRWANDSWARILTAGNLKSGRSATVTLFHCSEMAFWPNATTLWRGILGSCPSTPDTAIIAESTANGIGNEFHQLCLQAQDPSEDVWDFVFFGWHEHPEYQTPLSVPPDQFMESLSREEEALMRRFSLTLAQLNWRRLKIREFKGDIDGFRQEFPCDPEEAFISSGRPRFSLIDLRAMPIIDEAPVGELEESDYGPQKVIRFLENEQGAVTIYKKPAKGRRYAIGADTAWGRDSTDIKTGADPDYSVACVLDAETGEQVAKIRERLQPAEFGRYLAVLGKYYGWAFLVVEVNGPGIGTLDELLRQQYPMQMIYFRGQQPDQLKPLPKDKIGWVTTEITRQQLISAHDNAIRERSVTIRDPHTLQEHMTFVIKPSGKAEHQDGCHDDEVFATALALIGIQSLPSLKTPQGSLTPKPYASSAESILRRRRRGR